MDPWNRQNFEGGEVGPGNIRLKTLQLYTITDLGVIGLGKEAMKP